MANPLLITNKHTARLTFRPISEADFPYWLRFFQDPTSFAHWNEVIANPEKACREWYQKQQHRYENNLGGMNALVEKASGKLVGHAGLLIQQVDAFSETEIAYSLLPQYRGYGYATEAAIACRAHAFENKLARSLISIISTTNTPSQRVALKNGMILEKETAYKNNRVFIYRIDAA